MTDEERQELVDKLVELFDSSDSEDSQLAKAMGEASGIPEQELWLEWLKLLSKREDWFPEDLKRQLNYP